MGICFIFTCLLFEAEFRKEKVHLITLKYTSKISTLKNVIKGDVVRTFN